MSKKFICTLAVVILAICLLSGGCAPQANSKITEWKDLLKVTPEKTGKTPPAVISSADHTAPAESVGVKLYFAAGDDNKLASEERSIPKVEGVARQTLEELLKGPQNVANKAIAPSGTRLLDINLKPDGLCIVDLSSEAREVENQREAEIMIQAIANTLGQFVTIKRVEFMINGNPADSIGHYVLSGSVEPDYSW